MRGVPSITVIADDDAAVVVLSEPQATMGARDGQARHHRTGPRRRRSSDCSPSAARALPQAVLARLNEPAMEFALWPVVTIANVEVDSSLSIS